MTQPGETDGFSVSDHLKTILKHTGNKKIIDAVLVNDFLPEEVVQAYKAVHSQPVKYDKEEIKNLGIKIVRRRLIEENKKKLVRHSPTRVARAIYYWYRKQDKIEE